MVPYDSTNDPIGYIHVWYSTASAEPSFEHPSPRFTLTCLLKNDHRDRWFLPKFWVVTGVQFSPAANTARRGVRTPRISMAGHGGPWWLIAYFWLADHGKPVLFWKGLTGLKFPCFLFYACEWRWEPFEFRAVPILLRKLPKIS